MFRSQSDPASSSHFDRQSEFLPLALIAATLSLAAVALLATSPMDGDFWWWDAPRHALNGAFVLDFIKAHPFHDPVQWAVRYYLRLPALTILFYPPLFYGVEAATYAVFGVSHFAAQLAVFPFVILLGASSYAFARLLMPRVSALGTALLAMGMPEIAYWARQVMLDIPAYALLVTTALFFARYLRLSRPRDIYLAALFALAALYTKFEVAFILPVLLATFVWTKGRDTLRDRHLVRVAILGAIASIPAVVLTLRFGIVNIQSVTGRPGDLSRDSLGAWLYYGRLIPHDLGYVAAGLAVLGLGFTATRRMRVGERWLNELLLGWFCFGYIFFSTIGVREPRHGLFMLFPLAIYAVLALRWALKERAASWAVLTLGAATLAYSVLYYPPPVVAGYPAIGDYVAAHAPKNAVVVISAHRDGNFIFSMRTHDERSDIRVLRSDKLLLRMAVERSRGVKQAEYDKSQIAAMLRNLGVDLVVLQPGFWDYLQEMALFDAVIHSPDFKLVARFSITGNINRSASDDEHAIELYAPTYTVEHTPQDLKIEMPIIGDQFEDKIGQ